MLCLTRKLHQCIYVGEDITVKLISIDRNKVVLGIEAPKDIPILRDDARTQGPPTLRIPDAK